MVQYVHPSTWRIIVLSVWLPGQQYALILLQLSHKRGVGFGHSPTFFNVIKGFFQIPAVLLHGIGNHCGCRAAYTHFTVHQTLGPSFPGLDIIQACTSAFTSLGTLRQINMTLSRFSKELTAFPKRVQQKRERNSLGSRYKLIGVIPIGKQVSGLLIINTDVVVLKHTGEEVIDLSCYIQDVLDTEWEWHMSKKRY